MDFSTMTMSELEARMAEIRKALDTEGADIKALTAEVDAIEKRKKELETRAAQEAELRARVASGATGKVIEGAIPSVGAPEARKKEDVDYRSSLEYGKAFLNGIKTDNFAECRKLMTENGTVASGDTLSTATIPVPTLLDNEIRNAWEKNEILGLVKKTYQKGIVRCVFEVSATGASIHIEGADAPTEEKIVLGSVLLTPANIKKWITVSDEALEGTTVDTIGYLYKEIAQKIGEAAEQAIINNIKGAQSTTDATHPGVPVLSKNIDVDTILMAEALLSAQARDLNIVMNRQTKPVFMKKVLEAGYAIDVFDGLKDKIKYTDALDPYTEESAKVYAIIGDFGYGYQANFPNGNDITIKRDDVSLAEFDLVKLVGKQYVGHGIIAPKSFVNLKSVVSA